MLCLFGFINPRNLLVCLFVCVSRKVLIVGDSVSGGYIPYVKAALANVSNVQHGPDNTGGGMADNAGKVC